MLISKEYGLEVNVEKTKHVLVSRDQNAGQNQNIKMGHVSFENVSQFETTVTNQNLIQEKLGGDLILVMFATIRSRTFCLLAFCKKCKG
jgi:hypothetical protein